MEFILYLFMYYIYLYVFILLSYLYKQNIFTLLFIRKNIYLFYGSLGKI